MRILAATNKPLEEWVAAGRFRQDLYFRSNGFQIRLPSLRERSDDIEVLAKAFLTEITQKNSRPVRGFTPDALRALREHPWPGNVRELRNKVEMACILCQGERITLPDLFPHKGPAAGPRPPGPSSLGLPEEGLDWETMESSLLAEALRRAAGNVSKAARLLGLSRARFEYRARKFGLLREGALPPTKSSESST